MQGRAQNRALISFLTGVFALAVSVKIAPDAVEMLNARSSGDKAIRIENVYYSCVGGNSFAMVRNGSPSDKENFEVVEAEELTVYVPKSMSFEEDTPNIVTFPRRNNRRDVGVRNTIR